MSFVPFFGSLKPSEKAEANRPRIDISDLNKGTFKIVEHSKFGYLYVKHPKFGVLYGDYMWGLFFYKDNNGAVHVWDVPILNGHVAMPDMRWWVPTFECKHFGPSLTDGLVDESLPIKCHDVVHDVDPDMAWWLEQWQWSINGKNLKGMVSDMNQATGIIEQDYFIYGKRS